MSQLSVRDIPPDVLEALRQEAREDHVSVNSVIVRAVKEHVDRLRVRSLLASRLTDFRALSQEILERRGGRPTGDSAPLVREDRAR